jgi:hypothetical protein
VELRAEDVDHDLADERGAAARHLEEDAAERVDVRARVAVAEAAAELRGHVRGRAHLEAGACPDPGRLDLARELGGAEVEDLDALAADHLGVGDQEQALGLEVAVGDAGGVGGVQHVRDLAAEPAALLRIEPAGGEAGGEALALEQLGHEVRVAVGGGAVIDELHDAGVADRGRGLGLVEEPLHDVRAARQLDGQHPHDDAPAERLVLAEVDHADVPLADPLHDPIVTEQRPQHRELGSSSMSPGVKLAFAEHGGLP